MANAGKESCDVCRHSASGRADGPLRVLAVPGLLAALVTPLVLICSATADAAAAVPNQPAKPAAVVGDLASAPRAAAELHGHEQFRLTTHSAAARKQQLRADGVLDTRGHAFAGRVIAGRARNWLTVPHGAIRLITVVSTSTVTPPTPTCRFGETYTGTYQIRGGARRYASARGSGAYVTKITGRLVRKKGRCTSTIAYFSQSTVTSGSLRW
jgi:hypothetical protein